MDDRKNLPDHETLTPLIHNSPKPDSGNLQKKSCFITPGPVIARLSEGLGKALESPELRKRLADIGASTLTVTPAAAAERLREDMQALGPIVKSLGLKID